MKFAVVLFLFGAVGSISACSVSQTTTVQHEKLVGRWYEKLSLGDSLMVFFNKCIRDDITTSPSSGSISKTRSYVWKWFPWYTWNSQSSLSDKGTKWELTETGLLGFGQSVRDMAILAVDSDFVIIKTCPTPWPLLTSGDRVWVYWKTDATIGKDELNKVQAALDKAGESYKVTDFTAVSQSNC